MEDLIMQTLTDTHTLEQDIGFSVHKLRHINLLTDLFAADLDVNESELLNKDEVTPDVPRELKNDIPLFYTEPIFKAKKYDFW